MSQHVIIKSKALERWCELAQIPPEVAEDILKRAQEQIEEAQLDRVHPMLAAQTFLACLIACFEGCDLPRRQRREWLNDFFQIIEPVVAEQALTWVPEGDGHRIITH